ncbi:hypothetical protein RRG08_016630 [Elysia crispata]|uniref:Uncharacterized protein n=1 Tax=Elysia crispata TaxID=231223 RepID=A0AAE0YXW8_9GAST|nr:hypothetical protein RRG08_016630 [Elysia crispata]
MCSVKASLLQVDDDLVDVLRTLHHHRYLNHTVLILMGDHGARYPSFIRASLQGKMEERLPYFGFAFPPWFEKKYPQAIANLRTNTDRLSTPFDLYETFKDFIHFQGAGPGDVYKRGISLFKEIPTERSCQQAGVAVHWCACLDWRNISADDSGVQRAVRAAVDTLNNLTAPYRQDCALLALQVVGSASKLQPRRELLSFKSERLEDRQVDLSGNTKNTMTLYQLTVTTTPGGGQFEVTVTHHHEKDAFTVSEKEISRINRYNNDPACILKKNTQIRAYCYCNNNIKSKY